MGNPILDQFIQGMFGKVVPVIIGFGILGLILGEIRKWTEKKADQLGKSVRKARALRVMEADAGIAPHCPKCNVTMVRRTARRGINEGSAFWGCSTYPKCRGTRAV